MTLPGAAELASARAQLAGHVVRTPVVRADALDAAAGAKLFFKAESLQLTGSFKVRGAWNKIRSLGADELARGLITVSAGNAALGAAYAARAAGAALVVVMPENAVPAKLAAVAALGARIEKEGVTNATEAFARLARLREQHGYTLVHPFDDPLVIAGAGTAAAELLDEVPDLDCLVAPASGGGLLSGTLLAARTCLTSKKLVEQVKEPVQQVEVYGVQPEGAAGILASLAAGAPTAPERIATVADGLTAPRPGVVTFEMIRRHAAGILTVSDAAILAAMREIIQTLRLIVEPAGATALAGVLAARDRFQGRRVGIILSGSNAAPDRIREVLA